MLDDKCADVMLASISALSCCCALLAASLLSSRSFKLPLCQAPSALLQASTCLVIGLYLHLIRVILQLSQPGWPIKGLCGHTHAPSHANICVAI